MSISLMEYPDQYAVYRSGSFGIIVMCLRDTQFVSDPRYHVSYRFTVDECTLGNR